MTPHQWLAELAALVPPPKVHLVRYGGVFANRHHLRRAVARTPPSPMTPMPPRQLALLSPDGNPAWTAAPLADAYVGGAHAHDVSRRRRFSWARLLARVFSTDVTTCACGGRLRPLGAVLTPDDIAAHLHGARSPPRPPPAGAAVVAALTLELRSGLATRSAQAALWFPANSPLAPESLVRVWSPTRPPKSHRPRRAGRSCRQHVAARPPLTPCMPWRGRRTTANPQYNPLSASARGRPRGACPRVTDRCG